MEKLERVRLRFAPNLHVYFADREAGLRWLEEIAEKGTRLPVVIYGPEGCGKTAFFRQAFTTLKALGYSVLLVSPLEEWGEKLQLTSDVAKNVGDMVSMVSGLPVRELAEHALRLASKLLQHGVRRLAVLADDVFQAVGLDNVEKYVKRLLNLIEYPPREYENIVILVGTSEGTSRTRIARHYWATIMGLWNMSRNGLRELYEQIPGPKPSLDTIWAFTGGNPRILSRLYTLGWNQEHLIHELAEAKNVARLVNRLTQRQLQVLWKAVEDPDALETALREADTLEEKREIGELVEILVEENLVTELGPREYGWVDTPPPHRDPEIGVGTRYAWQTPAHREAVKLALTSIGRP